VQAAHLARLARETEVKMKALAEIAMADPTAMIFKIAWRPRPARGLNKALARTAGAKVISENISAPKHLLAFRTGSPLRMVVSSAQARDEAAMANRRDERMGSVEDRASVRGTPPSAPRRADARRKYRSSLAVLGSLKRVSLYASISLSIFLWSSSSKPLPCLTLIP